MSCFVDFPRADFRQASYVSGEQLTPAEALAQLVADCGVAGVRPAKLLHSLRHSPLADSWLVAVAGERAVLRIDRPAAAAMGLNRATEFACLKAVAAAGLGPAPIAADPSRGLLLRRHVEGSAWQPADLHQPANLARVAILLRDAHSTPIAVPATDLAPDLDLNLDLGQAIERYAGLAGQGAAPLAATARRLLARCQDSQATRVFCHNDPVADNFVAAPGGAGRLWLIDWEYSGFNEFWFDLAVVVAHHELPAALAGDFLGAWLGRPATTAELRRLARWCDFYASFARLWFMALNSYAENHP